MTGDAAAAAAAAAAAEKVAGVARELAARVTRYDAQRDHRAVFAYTYFRLTSDLAASLRTNGLSFRAPDWVADLSVSLAAGYFTAMDAIDTWLGLVPGARSRPGGEIRSADLPETIPKPWRDVYAASTVRHSYVLEEVLFSMMAHMSYDLPLALRALVARGEVHHRIADFHRMNDLLATSIDGVQEHIAARYCRRLDSLDRLFTRDDELFTSYGIRVARGWPGSTATGSWIRTRGTRPWAPSAGPRPRSSPSSAPRTTGGAATPSRSCGHWSPPVASGRRRARPSRPSAEPVAEVFIQGGADQLLE